MPEKDKVRKKEDEEFEKKCDEIKEVLKKMERKAKKPIPKWLWEWKVTI